jgi:hypothetical protein
MEKLISSNFTFFHKYLLTPIWSGVFGLRTIMLFIDNRPKKIYFLIAWTIGTLLIYLSAYALKKVSIAGNSLIISNYMKTISIPFSEISRISENRLINYRPISIYLKTPGEFGSRIIFRPFFMFCLPFRSHPLCEELKNTIENVNHKP